MQASSVLRFLKTLLFAPSLLRSSTVQERRLAGLPAARLAVGHLAVSGGAKSLGKSRLAASLAAHASRARREQQWSSVVGLPTNRALITL